ncbi:AraC family transcriptional regulator [Dickeya zeae]|uniref:Arabinose operon regulatory protein n=1 Tax=Dickeya zeae TaxID=204042 RepID=A0AAE6YXX9_9GAMM|nr:helix-turn-helix domain-containing protein [Dickeya zeae]QIZ50509.1 AraC family transcriptional regulator [Dickeya zeae]
MKIPNISFSHKQSKNLGIEVFELDSLARREYTGFDPQIPHRINFFMLIFIEEGTGVHQIDFEDYNFRPDSLIFIQREQVHAFDLSNHPKGKILIFTQEFLDHVHANMRLPNYTPTHLNPQHNPLIQPDSAIYRRAHILVNELLTEQSDIHKDTLLIMYLFSALVLLLRKKQSNTEIGKLSQNQSIKLARFFNLLQENYLQVRDATWYAGQVNTTYKTLNLICKIATGLTVKQMIDAFIIIEIKRQLVIRKVTTQQIAYEFGFEDASNFIKYFRKMTGVTPSFFQREHKI